MEGPDLDCRTALVMAHPDDEVLWASSLLARLDRIVLCFEAVPSFPDWGLGRQRSLAVFPLPGAVNLGLTEAETFDSAAWPEPRETAYGLEVRQHRKSLPNFSKTRYQQNFAALTAALRPELAGFDTVITHNPWGEYGHEDHVQVFRAVAALQAEMGFAVWVSCYVSDKSWPLMRRLISRLDCSAPALPTDPVLGEQLKTLYRENGCWTWFDDYAWPARETFYRLAGPGEPTPGPRRGSLVNLVWTEWRPLPSLWQNLPRRALGRGARLLRGRAG